MSRSMPKKFWKLEKDAELRELAKMELDEIAPKIETLEGDLKELLTPRDPNDDKDVVLEIRAGTGGDEASILLAIYSGCTSASASERD